MVRDEELLRLLRIDPGAEGVFRVMQRGLDPTCAAYQQLERRIKRHRAARSRRLARLNAQIERLLREED